MSLSPHFSLSVAAVLCGDIRDFGPPGRSSAIDKQPVAGSCRITRLGLQGDQQADRRVHGGPEKALHHYPRDHYAGWAAELPQCEARLAKAGAFGENLSTSGLSETEICIGDICRLGTALVQVSQARQPCWKLNVRFDVPDMALRVQSSGRTGWYYRVLEEGDVAAGDRLELVERPHPDWPLARLLTLLYHDKLNIPALQQVAALAVLAESWRKIARRRLETAVVEDWSKRVSIPAPETPADG
jgi:MOSC domain-containing protein YiiM